MEATMRRRSQGVAATPVMAATPATAPTPVMATDPVMATQGLVATEATAARSSRAPTHRSRSAPSGDGVAGLHVPNRWPRKRRGDGDALIAVGTSTNIAGVAAGRLVRASVLFAAGALVVACGSAGESSSAPTTVTTPASPATTTPVTTTAPEPSPVTSTAPASAAKISTTTVPLPASFVAYLHKWCREGWTAMQVFSQADDAADQGIIDAHQVPQVINQYKALVASGTCS